MRIGMGIAYGAAFGLAAAVSLVEDPGFLGFRSESDRYLYFGGGALLAAVFFLVGLAATITLLVRRLAGRSGRGSPPQGRAGDRRSGGDLLDSPPSGE